MACKVMDTEIDNVKYTTQQFTTREGLALTTRITKLIGPIFSGVNSVDSNIDLSLFTDKLSDANVVKLILDLLTLTYREGTKITPESFDIDFSGEYAHLLNVIVFVIESNGFFGKGNISKILDRLKSLKGLKSSQILPIKSTNP